MLSKIVIGKSWLMKDIFALKAGSGRKKLLVCASPDAEIGTVSKAVTMFAEGLCERNTSLFGFNVGRVSEKTEIFCLPQPNPDGNALLSDGAKEGGPFADRISRFASGGDFSNLTANARGVDIDRNFSVGWREEKKAEIAARINGPSLFGFCGEWPESEKETALLCAFLKRERFDAAMIVKSGNSSCFSSFGLPEKLPKIFCGYGNVSFCPFEKRNGSLSLWILSELKIPVAELCVTPDRAFELVSSGAMLLSACL